MAEDRLFLNLEHVGWEPDLPAAIDRMATEVWATNPLWIRVANWSPANLDLLRRLPPGQQVLWKLEYLGLVEYRRRGDRPCPAEEIAARMVAEGHRVVPYTFNAWNRDRIRRFVPTMRDLEVELVPVAQKPCLDAPARTEARSALGYGPGDTVLGLGGVLGCPCKGIEEVVDSFLKDCAEPGYRLLAQVIPKPFEEDRYATWRQGDAAADPRLRVRFGRYDDWADMARFYRAIDYFLVNSVCESWCRMLAEAVGYGVPSVALRTDAATNHIVPGLTTVDRFDFADPSLPAALRDARGKVAAQRYFVQREYSAAAVRSTFLAMLRRRTDPERLARFDALAGADGVAPVLDEALVK